MSAKPLQFSENDILWADMVCAQKPVEEVCKRVNISRATYFRRLNDARPVYRQFRELLQSRRKILLETVKPTAKVRLENLLDLRLDILNTENQRLKAAEHFGLKEANVLRQEVFDMAAEVAKHAGVYGIQLGGEAAKPILVTEEEAVTFEEMEAMEQERQKALPEHIRERHANS